MIDVANPAMKLGMKLFITGSISYILSPRVKTIDFLHGKNVQVKWFLAGKVLIFPLDK
jgi:hypothetical protein